MATTITRRIQPGRSGGRVASSRAPVSSTIHSSYRGEEGRARMKIEEERAKARKEIAQANMNMPFRYRIPPDGEARQLVIVDEAMDFFRHEHNAKDRRTGKWSIFCPCIGEVANCPACAALDKPAYFAAYLTVIDLEPYEAKDGTVIEWSKKLLVVKFQQQKKLQRLAETHGTLRGMILNMVRDGEKEASIGNDIEFVDFMPEDELLSYETTVEYETRDGKKKTREIIGHEPFDYEELFPDMTEQQIRAIVGGQPSPGSRDYEESSGVRRSRGGRSEMAEDEAEEEEETRPVRRGAAAKTAPQRTATRRPARQPVEEEAEEVAEEVDKEPQRPARRTAAAPARRVPTRQTREVAEEETEVVEEEEAPAPRRTATRAPVKTATTQRRAARPDPEEEPAEEEAPRRTSASSLAARRQALRR